MQDRTVPRLPKLPKFTKLTKLQALLLLGGAFVFAVLVWTAYTHKIVIDRTPAAPEGSVLAATILDRQSEDWLPFEARLPEKARQALSHAGDAESVTLFAVPGAVGGLDWGLLEALSARTERSDRKKFRLVPRGTSAIGYAFLNGRSIPFEAKVSKGLVQARVGRDFRGLSFEKYPFDQGRRQLAPINMPNAFIEKPAGVSWNQASALLGLQLQRFQPQAELWGLPGRLELSVSASETNAISPFILYYRPAHGHDLAGPTLEAYAKGLLAESDPIGFEVALPDDTEMTELRRDPDSILTERIKVKELGERAQLKAPGGTHQMEIFYHEDGEAWMSTELAFIQASIVGNVSALQSSEACETGGRGGFAAFSGKSLESWPFFRGMDRLTFSIHNVESGMFTTCGYFTP